MNYRINEIFLSLQGEGLFAGSAAVFVRLSGCNLRCPFCDTNFQSYEVMNVQQIVERIYFECGENPLPSICVITGGEPSLQLESTLIDALHDMGMQVNVETNGTHIVPEIADFVTLSPKSPFVEAGTVMIDHCNEVKVVMTEDISVEEIRAFEKIAADWYFIQPCDTGESERNKKIINRCVEFVKYHPNWRLSLQQQKIINVR